MPKQASPSQQTVGEAAATPAPSTPATVPALSDNSTGSDSGSKGGAVERESGESPKARKGAVDAAAVGAQSTTKETKKAGGGTLDSFWNSP